MLNDASLFNSCVYKMPKNNECFEDLYLTGGHGILVNTVSSHEHIENNKILGKDIIIEGMYNLLCSVSNKFEKIPYQKIYVYYHFILETDDPDERFGVYANGVLTETPSENLFLNHKYILI